jgi:hypothetical protein
MTTEDQTQPTKISTLSPDRTAGQLPSSRTMESCFLKPMASDDIDEVKAALKHIWFHYQVLELVVSDRKGTALVFENAKKAVEAGTHEQDVTDLEMATGYMAVGVVEGAYTVAHEVGMLYSMLGLDPITALKAAAFSHLDFSDPAFEVTDAELANLLNENTDETPKDEK